MIDERSREQQMFHWAETLEVVKMTRKCNNIQLAEKIMNGNRSGMHYYTSQERLPQRLHKAELLEKLKALVKEPKRINTKVHGRVYL